MPEEDCRIEVKRISPHSFGVLLYKNEKDVSLLDIIEATAIDGDGHFSLFVRGNKEPFETIPMSDRGDLSLRLYNKSKAIAAERLKQNYYCY